MVLRFCVWVFLVLGTQAVRAATANDYHILASIRPLALIASDIVALAELQHRVTVTTLLAAGQSAHHHAVKLSDIQRLKQADVLLWVGPSLEHYLDKPLRQHRTGTTLAFETVVPSNSGDPHQWLDYQQVSRFAEALGEVLRQSFPNANVARALRQFKSGLEQQHAHFAATYKKLNTTRGVVVYHDGFGHFLNRYGIVQLAALTTVPEQQISMKHLLAVKPLAEQRCLLVDVDEQSLARGYAAKLGATPVVVDLLASDPALRGYREFLEQISVKVAPCLQ